MTIKLRGEEFVIPPKPQVKHLRGIEMAQTTEGIAFIANYVAAVIGRPVAWLDECEADEVTAAFRAIAEVWRPFFAQEAAVAAAMPKGADTGT